MAGLRRRREVCAAERGGGGVLGLVAARYWMGEAQGGRGDLKEAPRISGRRARRDPGGDCGAAGA